MRHASRPTLHKTILNQYVSSLISRVLPSSLGEAGELGIGEGEAAGGE
jgi:hypothetical protein